MFGQTGQALGDALLRDFKARKFKCELITAPSGAHHLKFYVLKSEAANDEKADAVSHLSDYVLRELDPGHLNLPTKIPDNLPPSQKNYLKKQMERGLSIKGTTSFFEAESKHYVLYLEFPETYMDQAKKLQASFGHSLS